jgi:hypothetical protein
LYERGTSHISREHFSIDYADDNFYVSDRGSVEGTIVAGHPLGDRFTGGRTVVLHDGDEIIIGTNRSPFRFMFQTVEAAFLPRDYSATDFERQDGGAFR